METKLTRQDFESYKAQIKIAIKIRKMADFTDKLTLEAIEKELKKWPQTMKKGEEKNTSSAVN